MMQRYELLIIIALFVIIALGALILFGDCGI